MARRANKPSDKLEASNMPDQQTVASSHNQKKMQRSFKASKAGQPDSSMPSAEASKSKEPAMHVEAKPHSFTRPHKHDYVFTKARNALVAYNRQSLAHFTDPLRVEALVNEPTQYGKSESEIATLALVRRKDLKHVQLKLVRGRHPKARINILMCLDGGEWKPFEKYLDGLKTPKGQTRRGPKGIEQQQAWWDKNGKTFNLMGLPAELRDAFYGQLLPPDLYPISWWNDRRPYGDGKVLSTCTFESHRKYDPTHKVVPAPDLKITATCRQVKQEVERYLDIETTKCFTDWQGVSNFMKKLGDPLKFNNFSKVELDLSHREYILFFKIDIHPFPVKYTNFHRTPIFDEIAKDDLPARFRDLPHIKSLTLRFRSPFDAMRCDPWGYTGEYNQHEWFQDWNGRRDVDGFTTSCQKTIVDWILTFAKEYVQHIPEIKLKGAIKNSTKLKWDLIFKDEKNGDHHDMTEVKEAIRANLGPPPCECTTPCQNDAYHEICHWEACPKRLGLCYCKGGNINANVRHWEKKLKGYQFDFED